MPMARSTRSPRIWPISGLEFRSVSFMFDPVCAVTIVFGDDTHELN